MKPPLLPAALALLALPVSAQAPIHGAAKPAPRLSDGADLKALVDVRSPHAPARRALHAAGLAPLPVPLADPLPGGTSWRRDAAQALSWTRTPDQLAWDAPGDGRIWVRGRTYKASVGPDGLTYVPFLGSGAPRSWPVRLELRAARLDGHELTLARPAHPVREGDRVTLERGALREVLRFELEAVEQVFVLERLERRGELELELELESELRSAPRGQGFELAGPDGAVRYGGVTVLDADGRSLSLPSRLVDGRVVLRVPAEFVSAARLPLTVDPLITTLTIEGGATKSGYPDVAYDATHDRYLVAWVEEFSGSDYDVNSVLVSSSGSVLAPQYIDLTTARWWDVSLGGNGLAGSFLAAAQVDSQEIRGRIRPANGGAVGAQIVIAPYAGQVKSFPAVGGDASSIGPTYFLVVYERAFAAGDTDIHAQLVDGQGSLVGGTIFVDNSSGTEDFVPKVSRTNGHPPFGTQRWNVVWARGPQNGSSVADLRAAQLAWDGAVVTPSFDLTATPGVQEVIWNLSPSPPLDDPSGHEREWAVYYTIDDFPTAYRGTLALLRKDLLHDVRDLGTLLGVGNLSFYDGGLDADGCALVLGFSGGLTTRVATLLTTGHQLALSEGPIAIDPSVELARAVAYALAHGPSASGPRGLVVLQEGVNATSGDIYGALYEARDHWLGNVACHSNPNSSGFEAFLSAVGSEKLSDNRVTVECENLPLFQNGILILSKGTNNVPFGQGVLCLAPPVYRFAQQVQNSGPQGWISLPVNLGSLPGGAVIQPGETWYFQYWTRDGSAVNLSNSLGIQFQ